MAEILLIDDDKELCELLIEYLHGEGHRLTVTHNGNSGLKAVQEGKAFQLILLDVTMPMMNGFETLKALRKFSDIPVIMLTARGDEIDRIVGLELGADDYLPKPFNLRELTARISAIFRRLDHTANAQLKKKQRIEIDDISMSLARREVHCGDTLVNLTATEFTVLKILIDHCGELVTRNELTRLALNRELEPYDRAIDMHVSNLRNKIGFKPDGTQRIKTVRGAGYFYIA